MHIGCKKHSGYGYFRLFQQNSVLWPYNAEKVTPLVFPTPPTEESKCVCVCAQPPRLSTWLEVLVRVLEKQKIFFCSSFLIIALRRSLYSAYLLTVSKQMHCSLGGSTIERREKKQRRELKNN